MPNKSKKYSEGAVSGIKHTFSELKRSFRKQIPVSKDELRNKSMDTLVDCQKQIGKLKLKFDNFIPEDRAAAEKAFEAYKERQMIVISHAMSEIAHGNRNVDINATLQSTLDKLAVQNTDYISHNAVTVEKTVDITTVSSWGGSSGDSSSSSYVDSSTTKPVCDITSILGKLEYRLDRNKEANIEEVVNDSKQDDTPTPSP